MRTRFLRWNKKHFSSSVKGFSRQKLSQTWKCAFKVLCYLPESLFYKINTCLQKTTTCIGLRPEHIFSVNFQYIYFFNSGLGFYRSFLCYLQLLIIKRFWNSFFLHCTSIGMTSNSMTQIFKILFQTGALQS